MRVLQMPANLTVLVFRRQRGFVGQVLEHNFVAQARTLDGLRKQLYKVLATHVAACEANGLRPFESRAKAPELFWRTYWQLRKDTQAETWEPPKKHRAKTRHNQPIVRARRRSRRIIGRSLVTHVLTAGIISPFCLLTTGGGAAQLPPPQLTRRNE